MAAHFPYKHLPASGLGDRDPLRPYSTGGIGGAVPIVVYITDILEQRIYGARGSSRDTITTDRNLLVSTRDFIVTSRDLGDSERDRVRIARVFADVVAELSRMDREMRTGGRTYRSGDRDLN